jgi:hypothetical protein
MSNIELVIAIPYAFEICPDHIASYVDFADPRTSGYLFEQMFESEYSHKFRRCACSSTYPASILGLAKKESPAREQFSVGYALCGRESDDLVQAFPQLSAKNT